MLHRNYSLEIRYRILPILAGFVFFAACALWILFGPETNGLIGRILENSVIASATGGSAAGLASIFLFYLLRAMVRLPAIATDEHKISVYIIPFKKFDRNALASITTDGKWLRFEPLQGPTRKINLKLLDCESLQFDQFIELAVPDPAK